MKPTHVVYFTKKRKNRMLRDSASAIAIHRTGGGNGLVTSNFEETSLNDLNGEMMEKGDMQELLPPSLKDSFVVYSERTAV